MTESGGSGPGGQSARPDPTRADRPAPRFYGVAQYQDRLGRFSLRYPITWERHDLIGRDGARLMPNPDDPDTHLTVWADPLDARVVAEDLDDLRAGVREGLDALADASVELENDVVLGNLLKFERVYCFRESGAVRKRKQWLLYVDTWIVVLTWQGSNPEEYDYWYAMANYSFASFSLPEALWPFLDRDLFLSGRDPSPGG